MQKKICMLGAFAVGKTSLVSRYVHDIFSDRYLTTIGVKVEKKTITFSERDPVDLIVWDLAGEDELMRVRTVYLRGTAGYLLVVDGTRAATLATARELRDRVRSEIGEVPYAVLLNKADLRDDWEVDVEQARELATSPDLFFQTSAKTGDSVDKAFRELATLVTASRA